MLWIYFCFFKRKWTFHEQYICANKQESGFKTIQLIPLSSNTTFTTLGLNLSFWVRLVENTSNQWHLNAEDGKWWYNIWKGDFLFNIVEGILLRTYTIDSIYKPQNLFGKTLLLEYMRPLISQWTRSLDTQTSINRK